MAVPKTLGVEVVLGLTLVCGDRELGYSDQSFRPPEHDKDASGKTIINAGHRLRATRHVQRELP